MLKLKRIFFIISLVLVSTLFSACTDILGPQKAGLQVTSAEIPSSVFIDDQYLDKTPLINKELKPGDYILKIQADDPKYASYESKVSLQKGLLTVVTWKAGIRPEFGGGVVYEMEKSEDKNKSQLSLISIPDRAIVSIDGKEKDFAPFLIENISPGHHEFEVSLPSYESQKHTINVLEGYRMLVSVKLAKQNYVQDVLKETDEESSVAKALEDEEKKASDSASINKIITDSRVLIKSTKFFVEDEEVLRVRDKLGSGKEIGFAKVGQEYKYLDETKSNWHKINFEGEEGWISGEYAKLIEE